MRSSLAQATISIVPFCCAGIGPSESTVISPADAARQEDRSRTAAGASTGFLLAGVLLRVAEGRRSAWVEQSSNQELRREELSKWGRGRGHLESVPTAAGGGDASAADAQLRPSTRQLRSSRLRHAGQTIEDGCCRRFPPRPPGAKSPESVERGGHSSGERLAS